MPDTEVGLIQKYVVQRVDGRDVEEVRARLTELYGPDEANWPKFQSGGR